METIEQKKRRIYGKQYIDKYIKELNKLLIHKVSTNQLLSIVETDEIINKTSNRQLIFSQKLLFSNKVELKKILEKNASNVYLPHVMFTSLSRDCGAIRLDSLMNFNLDFNFNDESTGIISFVNTHHQEYIVLDFYDEDRQDYLDVEIYKVMDIPQ